MLADHVGFENVTVNAIARHLSIKCPTRCGMLRIFFTLKNPDGFGRV
jgi:hypothetical protein